jgi:hypothetical protein
VGSVRCREGASDGERSAAQAQTRGHMRWTLASCEVGTWRARFGAARLAWPDAHPCCWQSHREARAELTMARVRGAVIFVRVRECFKGRTMTFADAE